MEFIIHSYEGIEVSRKEIIRFGMSQENVKSFFDEVPRSKTSKSDSFDVILTIQYSSSLQFSFNPSDTLYTIACGRLAVPIFMERSLLHEPYQKIKQWLSEEDPSIEIEKTGSCKSPKFGLGIWAPGYQYQQSSSKAQGVRIFDSWV